ncbi:MAG: tetratricopeptide repeat protein [Candidatus Binatia bacterium]
MPKGLPQPEPRTVPEQAKPIEKEKKENRSSQQPSVTAEGSAPPEPQDPTAALPDDSSLVAKISPQTSPRRAASLRLTEEGKKMLANEDYRRALGSLERSIAIDSSNPYNYYYLAKAHYHLARYQESLNFLDVAESRLVNEPYWLAETLALRGENFRALGFFQRAESSYTQALKLNPGNKIAGEGMSRLRSVNQRFPR